MLWGIRPLKGVRHAHTIIVQYNNDTIIIVMMIININYLSRITPSVKSSNCYQLGPAGA